MNPKVLPARRLWTARVCCLVVFSLATPLIAQAPLGEPQQLEAERIRLAVDTADIELRYERERPAQARASKALKATFEGPELILRLAEAPGTQQPGTQRPSTQRPRSQRLRLEVWVRPQQTVHIEGTDLSLDVVDPLQPGDEPEVAVEDDEDTIGAPVGEASAPTERAEDFDDGRAD